LEHKPVKEKEFEMGRFDIDCLPNKKIKEERKEKNKIVKV